MKKSLGIIFGAAVIVLGLLIALGPQFLFKTCNHTEESVPQCLWSARAEIGIGALIALLGACMMLFSDPKSILGLAIGTFLAGLVALFIPHSLIGGCSTPGMKCQTVGFPALTVESIVLVLCSVVIVVILDKKYRVLGN